MTVKDRLVGGHTGKVERPVPLDLWVYEGKGVV